MYNIGSSVKKREREKKIHAAVLQVKCVLAVSLTAFPTKIGKIMTILKRTEAHRAHKISCNPEYSKFLFIWRFCQDVIKEMASEYIRPLFFSVFVIRLFL